PFWEDTLFLQLGVAIYSDGSLTGGTTGTTYHGQTIFEIMQHELQASGRYAVMDTAGCFYIRAAPVEPATLATITPAASYDDGATGTVVDLSHEPLDAAAHNACFVLWA